MNSELKMLVFRGGRRREQILLNENVIELPVGQITCSIMRLDDAFFNGLKIVPEELKQIAERYRLEIQEVYERQRNETGKRYLLLVRECLDKLISCGANETEQLLLRLLVYLPCFEAYSRAYDASERLLPGKSYLREITSLLADPNSDDSRISENTKAFITGGSLHDLSVGWGNFIDFLTEKTESGFWGLTANVVFAEDGYTNKFINCLTEFWRLKKDLQYAWDESDQKYTLTELRQHLAGPRILDRSSQSGFFSPEPHFTLKGEMYGIVSFTELVMAELNLMALIDRNPRRCELCGRYFVPYQRSAVYCSMPNPAYNNQSCAKVGARLRYQRAHPFLKTPLGQTYLRNYKAYSMWLQRNKAFLIKNDNEVYSFEPKGVREEQRKKILNDLHNGWFAWIEKTSGAISSYTSHIISDEELLAAIELPPPRERSPLMAEFRAQAKRSKL